MSSEEGSDQVGKALVKKMTNSSHQNTGLLELPYVYKYYLGNKESHYFYFL